MLKHRTGAIAAVWILGAGAIGLLTNVRSIGVAAVILGFAVVPPFFLLMRPKTSMSGR